MLYSISFFECSGNHSSTNLAFLCLRVLLLLSGFLVHFPFISYAVYTDCGHIFFFLLIRTLVYVSLCFADGSAKAYPRGEGLPGPSGVETLGFGFW